jgi:nucleotide-binding universal stress UspA family protein
MAQIMAFRIERREKMMRKVLLAVDGSEHSDQAARYLVGFVKEHGPVDIHVANVEPEPIAWQTHGMEEQAIEAHLAARARHSMKSAKEILNASGSPHHCHVGRGEVAQTLLTLADKLGCDTIVMGSRGLGAVSGIAMGSVTRKVLHLTRLPVVCVK